MYSAASIWLSIDKNLSIVMIMPWLLLLNLLILSPLSTATEALYQSHASIHKAVANFLESDLRHFKLRHKIQFRPLDHRLKLRQCGRPLEIFLPHADRVDAGKITLGVRCVSPAPWTIYTGAEIAVYDQVVVLVRPLKRGSPITRADIRLEEKDISDLRGQYFRTLEKVLNLQTTRALTIGTVLSTYNSARPKWVKRGQKVVIRASNPGIEVRMTGQALSDGESGQRIRIRNEASNRIVEATVMAPGVVNINP